MKKMIVIIGLGKTGFSCARYLTSQHIPFRVMDSRGNPPGLAEFNALFPGVPVTAGKFDEAVIHSAETLLVSPGVSPQTFPPEKVQGDMALFARAAKAPIIAVTGTNAKGTVTTLVGEMVKAAGRKSAVGGNIGTPALDLLFESVPDFYVLEVSSFQLEMLPSLRNKAAAILNLSPDHLDRHQTMENYQKIKQRLYVQSETAVFNRQDAYTFPLHPTPHQISFGLDIPAENQFGLKENHLMYGENVLLPVEALKIQGRHNYLNALAALALGQAAGLPMSAMLTALENFSGLPHRCEWITTQQDIVWINDSKATNIGAALAALTGWGGHISGKIILIAGGTGKGADFTLLQDAVKKYTKKIILIGQDASLMAKALEQHAGIQYAADLASAVQTAHKLAVPGDAVMLSPACASFDMFNDFEDRGNQFKTLVKDLFHL
jgi:UDP-N-acetylmuramoylalanine--D-glutamate ligase